MPRRSAWKGSSASCARYTSARPAYSASAAQIVTPVSIDIDQEALPTIDINTGQPVHFGDEPDAIRLDEHHELDLGPAVRDAISLAEPIAPLCRPDCAGLCLECGQDLNLAPGHHHEDDELDPRLAGLAALLDDLE